MIYILHHLKGKSRRVRQCHEVINNIKPASNKERVVSHIKHLTLICLIVRLLKDVKAYEENGKFKYGCNSNVKPNMLRLYI